jgi:fluoroquinolone transport system permease protein
MRTLVKLIKWDLLLLIRYNVMTVALAVGAIYLATILLTGIAIKPVLFLIYSDPAMLGFIFIGVIVLFEKQSDTLSVMKITPAQPWQYLLSKLIALTVPSLFVGIAMGLAARIPNMFLLGVAIFLASSLMLLLGFAGVVRVNTFNQYMMVIPLFLAPLSLPLVSFLGIFDTPLMWIIPTHSLLILFGAAGQETNMWETIAAILVALMANFFSWRIALRSYRRYITEA